MKNLIPPPKSLPPNSKVWGYLRDSGGPSQGESIERQRDEIVQFCTQYGLMLQHLFVDEAHSGGSTSERDEFNQLIDASTKPDHADGL